MSENEVEVINLPNSFQHDKELQTSIYHDCWRLGCCERCCARFACVIEDYRKPDVSRIDVKSVQGSSKDEWELVENKQVGNCAVCLGALEESIIREVLQHKGIHLLSNYYSEDFRLESSLPICSLIRERCMIIYLREKYGDSFLYSEVRPLKHVFNRLLYLELARLTSKVPTTASRVFLKIIMHYPLDTQEVNQICRLPGNIHDGTFIGKRRVQDALSAASDEEIKTVMKVPPEKSLLDINLTNVFCHSKTIILRGLFNRYSRLLPQITQTCKKKNVFNYATIVRTALQDVLDDENLEVSFKGTEYFLDHSRILGISGEVMFLEIIDCKHPYLREEQLKAVEQRINENRMVFVKDLHQVGKITAPERGPIECCKVLCMVFDKDLEECIDCINNCGEIQVTQRMPLKWLSTKRLDSRLTTIYKLAAASVPGKTNLLEVCLWIQASELSLAIPEFINGDFGRTKPSLSDIAGAKIDMLAIDHIVEETFN